MENLKKLFSAAAATMLLALALSPCASAQTLDPVQGTVVDAAGAPLTGAMVTLASGETTTGAYTDAEGHFVIDVKEGTPLTISFIGFLDKVAIAKNGMKVTLEEDINVLEEVVMVAYGSVKKKDLTGSVAQIGPGSYKAQPVQGISEMLRGNAPGVFVKTNGDGSTKTRIRGTNSINGNNDPLYIIDGVPNGSYSPNDVESIEILKDASATALYGSRGANGVILITTKRGKTGRPTVEVSANASFATYPKYYDLLDGNDFPAFHNSYRGASINFDKSVDTDWQRELTQTGIRQNYQANVSGGTDNMKFFVSGQYVNNTGLVKNQRGESYGFRSNVDFKLGKNFTSRIDLSGGHGFSHSSDITSKGPLLNALQWCPNLHLTQDGEPLLTDPYGITQTASPYYQTTQGNNNSFSDYITVNAYFAYEILPGFKASVQPMISKSKSESRNFDNEFLSSTGNKEAYRSASEGTTWQITGLLTYDKTFASKHNLGLMAGTEVYKTESTWFSSKAVGVMYDYMLWNNLGSTSSTDKNQIGSSYGDAQLASFFARVNYNYDSRYYLTATWRADGSSKFQKKNQFSYFPSVALSWVASNESFLKDASWLNQLKVRGSWGITGSQAIGSYATIATLKVKRPWSWGTNGGAAGIEVKDPVNTNLKWEETRQWDLGIDARLIDKWQIGIDYYNKTTTGLLTERALPDYAGSGSTYVNLGKMKNTGVDIALTYTPFSSKNFSWTMTATASWMKNKVVDLGEIGESFIPDDDSNFTGVQLETSPLIVKEGKPLGQLYGYKWLGLWKTSEAAEAARYGQKPGDNRYFDANDNGQYDNDDCQVLGNFTPKFLWSYNTTINWKNFDFNLLLEAAHGQDMFNFNRMLAGTIVGMSGSVNLREAAQNTWSESNQNSRWCPYSTTAMEKANSSKWVEKAGYVKLRNISVGYTIPSKLLGGHEFRINASVQNVLTLTNYKGLDPEAAVNGNRGNDIYGGADYGTFPQPRIYTVGLTYKF